MQCYIQYPMPHPISNQATESATNSPSSEAGTVNYMSNDNNNNNIKKLKIKKKDQHHNLHIQMHIHWHGC